MRIRLETPVEQDFRAVMRQFDRKLFEALVPPGISIDLKRFDGSKKGDHIHLVVKLFGLIRQEWKNFITEDGQTEEEAWFVDVGRTLPFPLKSWQHRHIARKSGTGAVIVDLIDFQTGTLVTDALLYPFLTLQFALRKPIYRKYFRKDS